MTRIGISLTIDNPVIVASGPWSLDIKSREVGAIITPGITRFSTYSSPLFRKTSFGWVARYHNNSPGVDSFIEQTLPFLLKKGPPIIANIPIVSGENYIYSIRKLNQTGISGYELNMSCFSGNQDNYSIDIHKVISRIRKNTDLPLIIKIPSEYHYVHSLLVNQIKDVDAITLSGTIPVLVKDKKQFSGGLVGSPIKMINLAILRDLRHFGLKIPILVSGGAETEQDIRDYLDFGASGVQIGSPHIDNMKITDNLASCFSSLT